MTPSGPSLRMHWFSRVLRPPLSMRKIPAVETVFFLLQSSFRLFCLRCFSFTVPDSLWGWDSVNPHETCERLPLSESACVGIWFTSSGVQTEHTACFIHPTTLFVHGLFYNGATRVFHGTQSYAPCRGRSRLLVLRFLLTVCNHSV